jgi:hypothetical protein
MMSTRSGRRPTLQLSPVEERNGELGVLAFIAAHGLIRAGPPLIITSTLLKSNPETVAMYHRTWNEMYKYSVLRGDYRSACILNRNLCPDMPFPVSPQTICEYVGWKVLPPTQQLRDPSTQELIVDIYNNPLFGTGAWHAPGLLDKFNGAMLCLHNAYEHPLEVYLPVCVACIRCHEQYMNGPHYVDTCFGSCTAHPGCPQLIPKGNPMVSNLVKTYIRKVKEFPFMLGS